MLHQLDIKDLVYLYRQLKESDDDAYRNDDKEQALKYILQTIVQKITTH